MSSQDPSLVLLYECVKSVGAKKIDWKQVGKALGINATAARMRYTRFEARMKGGGVIRSRVAVIPRVTPKKSDGDWKKRTTTPASRKRAKAEDYESESAVSTDEDKNDSESEGDIKEEDEDRTTQRRTRGVQQDLNSAFEGCDDDSESGSDAYDEAVEKNDISDDDMSDAKTTPMAQASAKNSRSARQFSRSGSPPLSPGRFVRSERPSYSPLSPASMPEGLRETNGSGEMSEMSRDRQIKRDFSVLKDGMMLSATYPPSSPNTSRKMTAGNTSYVEESAIFQSIERNEDDEEESEVEGEVFESADEETSEGDDDGDESDTGGDEVEAAQPVAQKGAMGPPPVPAAKASMSYFGWMRTAVNRA